MAEITSRRRGELVQGVFAVLMDKADGLPAAQVLKAVEQLVPPTEFERETYPRNPSVRRYEKTIRFATITSVKAGWLVKSGGSWSLTDEGRRAYQSFSDPEAFEREAVRGYRAWEKERQPQQAEIEEASEVVDSTGTLEEAQDSAWAEIRAYLTTMPPYDFQRLVGALLKAMDYYVDWIAPPGPDGGIDLIAHTDPLGTTGPRIKVQVKRRDTEKVSAESLRAFMAVLGDQDVGIYISAAGFSSQAEREARSQEKRRLKLIDLERFVELWVQHMQGLPDPDRRRLPLKPVYFLASAPE
ncbi:MAG TPA: restriction endonuclease [Solirubrobacteraceae bacterium]|nr:restriction endonuclease [Solirubrobacteraceae bacterium]